MEEIRLPVSNPLGETGTMVASRPWLRCLLDPCAADAAALGACLCTLTSSSLLQIGGREVGLLTVHER